MQEDLPQIFTLEFRKVNLTKISVRASNRSIVALVLCL